eukprot:6188966-Pleurochrysis_carterae.AAC.1
MHAGSSIAYLTDSIARSISARRTCLVNPDATYCGEGRNDTMQGATGGSEEGMGSGRGGVRWFACSTDRRPSEGLRSPPPSPPARSEDGARSLHGSFSRSRFKMELSKGSSRRRLPRITLSTFGGPLGCVAGETGSLQADSTLQPILHSECMQIPLK